MAGVIDGIKEAFSGNKNAPKERTVLTITPLGKTKSENFDLPDAKWRVLSALYENGPSTIRELAQQAGMEDKKTKEIAKALIAEGYVRKAAATE